LHIDELTYSVTAPENEPRVTGGVLESYRRLSIALYRGLQTLGVTPERAQAHEASGTTSGPACFDKPSNYEVTALQRKLVGSAQKRGRGVVLQHGSLPLHGDVSRVRLGLRFESEDQRVTLEERLHQQATTLAEALAGRAMSWRDSADAIRTGFEQTLNIEFEEIALNSAELSRAHQIRAEKYANDTWTKRK
jgi:lipoate-protein ligase A